MPYVALTTLGCKVNQVETEVIEGLFRQRGYTVVSFEDQADVYVINTCSVTHLGEKKSRQLIRRAVRLNPGAVVVVTGCFAQISPDKVEAIPGVDVIVGTSERQKIVDLAEAGANSRQPIKAVSDIMTHAEFEDIPLFHVPGRTRAFLKIQEGCTNFCTYCIIPYARGPLRSRPVASVIAEAEKMVRAGFQEIVLTGIHLGAYGRDLHDGVDLTTAVKAVLGIPGLVRLRLGSLESIEVSDELLQIMKEDERFCRHLHLPLQAASDKILSDMNRHYTRSEYGDLVAKIRSEVDGIAISTDIIVGFPGETQAIFEESLYFIQSQEFSRIHIFPYSKRSGTPAASYSDQVAEDEKRQRVARLQQLARQSADSFHQSFLGSVMDVLIEAGSNGVAEGLTSNYIRVYVAEGEAGIGQMTSVRFERLYRDGIWGTIVN
mgnify:FL=1